ncbi:hypothetical protein [Nocardiopsis chromatogenes]|uniref:hypothetical protein n=1 Tax=Nocardiopsis chromatogenes TaxID=280239 RepID=UPI00034D8C14|nr:hypothetical protein [Nocardiopsis chromatogenes]
MAASMRYLIAVPALILVTACGASGGDGPSSEDAAATPSASSPSSSPPPSSSAPSPASPDASAADGEPGGEASEADGEGGGGEGGRHPLEGTWQGPQNEDGTYPEIRILANGAVSIESSGFTCNGEIDTAAGEHVLTVTQCLVPIPSMTLALSDDGRTIEADVGDETETWTLLDEGS